ncbi:unnamed protein product [Microthlaspi erraticum]|uniref:F-box domain-containing protein n=1 Tax=Microthlaspi erraticum TaxID=1685480 RepID=A0A6D2HRZ5_9BRAS|nr:unnamed protein product [Microthlaspi erraticum]CAA7018553.1 unnamed protein product [Microthlaspi erraticum]
MMATVKESLQVNNIHYLPDDLLLDCLARVSRLYYPTLSLVSKRFRSIIASIELYQTRTLLGRTETCLYLCINFLGCKQRWFTLCRRPTQTRNPNPKPRWFTACFRPYRIQMSRTRKEEKKPSENLMVPVFTRIYSTSYRCVRALIGSNIYRIGKQRAGNGFGSRVFFLDCRSHTWHEAPSMPIAQNWPLVSVLDGKIYVVEDHKGLDSSNLIESFDPKTQKWAHVPGPSAEIAAGLVLRSLAMDGKLYLFGIDKTVAYKPKENKWDVVELDMRLGSVDNESFCVIDNVMYSRHMSEMFQWYDSKGRLWRDLKGLEELPISPNTRVRLVNYGGKIAALWGKQVRSAVDSDNMMIWCAVIAVEIRNEQEVYGKIEWCDVVLTVPKSCRLEFLAVNV